ncbi:hypothetical protein SAMN06893096_104464 [Geodermatophilus pulveris]|uniref:Uncharacterized protein n=1 Tax=Geodermatophilus pulveris TaxID=1564159 RepID=A0A239F4K2_9ACTN|nr:esterase [Geodermatophilus pulveris]SNS51767.1 hypothetical protein SAMN06893096_104464 [Geodermatophilus pulveris]
MGTTRRQRRWAAATATTAVALALTTTGVATAGPPGAGAGPGAPGAGYPGHQPPQLQPAVPAVPASDIDWEVADPAFDHDPATGERGEPFTPLLDEQGAPRTRVLTGVDSGAAYRIEVPLAGWNGEVVFWEHGYRGTGPVLYVSDPAGDLRETYVDAGYAWAASSYSANRYDVPAGAVSTERLARLFDDLVAPASRRYLQGVSMGGHVIGELLERQQVPWSGAAPMCGVMGDVEQFDIRLDYNLVAQALAEVDGFPIPEDYVDAVIPLIKERLGLPDEPVGDNPPLTERGEVLRDVVIDLTGGPRPGDEAAFTYWEGLDFQLARFADDPTGSLSGVTPGWLAENVGTRYPTSYTFPDGTTLNEAVERVAAAPGARRTGPDAYVPDLTAAFEVPVLSVHTLGDLFVPFEHQQVYAAEAADLGTGDLLVQRTVRSAGHCEFTPEEYATTFTDLVRWVESREAGSAELRPAGEDVLSPSAVADPAFGCRFTTPVETVPEEEIGTRRLYDPCPAGTAPPA